MEALVQKRDGLTALWKQISISLVFDSLTDDEKHKKEDQISQLKQQVEHIEAMIDQLRCNPVMGMPVQLGTPFRLRASEHRDEDISISTSSTLPSVVPSAAVQENVGFPLAGPSRICDEKDDSMVRQLEIRSSEVEHLKHELQSASENLARVEKENRRLTETVSSQEQELLLQKSLFDQKCHNLSGDADMLRSQLENAHTAVQQSHLQCDELEKTISSLRTDVSRYKSENALLRQQLDSACSESRDRDHALAHLRESITHRDSEIKNLRVTQSVLQAQLLEERANRDLVKSTAERAQVEIDRLTKLVSSIQSELLACETKLAAAHSSAQSDLALLQNQLQTERDEHAERLKAIVDEKDVLKLEHSTAIDNLLAENKAIVDRLKREHQEILDTREQNWNLVRDNDVKRARAEVMSLVEQERERALALAAELESARKLVAESSTKLDSKDITISTLIAELNVAKKSLAELRLERSASDASYDGHQSSDTIREQKLQYCFLLSGITDPEIQNKVQSAIEDMGATVVKGTGSFLSSITHVCSPTTSYTLKTLAGIVSGRHVVTPEYVLESHRLRTWLAVAPPLGARISPSDLLRGRKVYIADSFYRENPKSSKTANHLRTLCEQLGRAEIVVDPKQADLIIMGESAGVELQDIVDVPKRTFDGLVEWIKSKYDAKMQATTPDTKRERSDDDLGTSKRRKLS